MFPVSKRPPVRRVVAGARALCQGLLGVALIALAAFVLLPSAYAMPRACAAPAPRAAA